MEQQEEITSIKIDISDFIKQDKHSDELEEYLDQRAKEVGFENYKIYYKTIVNDGIKVEAEILKREVRKVDWLKCICIKEDKLDSILDGIDDNHLSFKVGNEYDCYYDPENIYCGELDPSWYIINVSNDFEPGKYNKIVGKGSRHSRKMNIEEFNEHFTLCQ